MHSIRDLMFDKKDFCEHETTATSTSAVSHSSYSPKTISFTDKLNAESCIQPKHPGNQQHRVAKAESNQFYWIIAVTSLVLLVNLIGGIYFYFRFAKIESKYKSKINVFINTLSRYSRFVF